MHHLLLGLLVLLAGCAASQPRAQPQPQPPQPQYILSVDADWVQVSPQIDIRRRGFGSRSDEQSRHYWTRIPNQQEGTYMLNEWLADCPSRRVMLLSAVVYKAKTGKPIDSYNSPFDKWAPGASVSVTPGSIGELAFDFACQPPEVR